ncbi:hypothetical protein BDM02DRAFT_1379420 [Thelephora ganbajun]|uniref:Uncharacterized protein n=1 Tax=Thelephora ganbajun TaxID=370292 RepID=A0ACB6ZM47_THEGA|nr:hypothetical protein BDM02DRAFT_1379420 [Thelephora ganbajun]
MARGSTPVLVIGTPSLGRETRVLAPAHPSRPRDRKPHRMERFRHTLHRWRRAILGKEENEAVLECRQPEPADEPIQEPWVVSTEPFLDLSTITATGTWKDLPQEIVDYIIFMLGNDMKSLKACSLTCKAMFVSTRHVIHRKMRLTCEKNWELLTTPEKQRYIRGDRQGIAVRVLDGIATHGLFPYARHLFIHLNRNFTPVNLQPFNHHFQRFDRVQELSIYWLHTPGFLKNFDTFFANFVPTLRSLHLDVPTGDTQDILDFVCRFPHLDDLTLEMSSDDPPNWKSWKSVSLPIVRKMPPFQGRLKLRRIGRWHSYMPQQLTSLPGKRRFRFVDFRSCSSEGEQFIIDACSGTIETLSTTWKKYHEKGLPLNLVDVTNLRSLTLRVDFEAIENIYGVLSQTLHTITSPFFSEFVLEVEWVFRTLGPANSAWKWWGTWAELDEMFERIDNERGFKVVIRAENMHEHSNFMRQAEDRLPLMAARERLVFEIGPFPEA